MNPYTIEESQWKRSRAGQEVSGLLSDRTIIREISGINKADLQALVETLRLRTSILNPDDGQKYYTVENPSVDGVEQPGVWRGVNVLGLENPAVGPACTIQQTLAYGWATAIAGLTTNNWIEARISQQRFLQDQPTVAPDGTDNTSPNEKYLEVYWPNLSRSHLQAMMESLSATTFTDPIVQDEKRTGKWHNLVVTPSMAKDGSGVITLLLAISKYRLDGFSTWLTHRTENVAYLWGYAKDEAQAVANTWKAKGRTCTFQYNKNDGLVDIVLRERDFDPLTVSSATSSWNCRYKEIADYYFGVDDPKLYPLATEPANGISYDRRLHDNGDGSWDITVITRNVQYRDIGYQVSQIAADSSVETRQQLGLTTQTPEAMASVAGMIKSQKVEVRDDCSKDVVTNKDAGIAQTSTTQIKSADATTVTTEKTVQETPLDLTTTPAVGTIRRLINRASRYFNRYETVEDMETGIAQTSTTIAKTPDSMVKTTEKTVQAIALVDTEPTAGTIRRIINAASKYFNRYTTTEAVETGNSQTIINTIRAPDATTVITENTVQDTELVVLALEAGVLKRIRNVWSKYFDRWDTTEEVETGIAQTTVATALSADEANITTEKTVQTAKLKAVPTVGFCISGTTVTVYGSVDGITIPETGITVANNGCVYIRRTIADDTMLVATAASVPADNAAYLYYGLFQFTVAPVGDPPVQTTSLKCSLSPSGIIPRVVNQPSKYPNRWNTTDNKNVGIPQTTVATVETGMEKSVTTEKTVQAMALPNPVAPIVSTNIAKHKIQHVTNAASKYPNRYTTTLKEDTPKPVSVPEYIAHIDDRGTTYQSEEKHATAAPNIMTYKDSAGVTKTATLDAQGNPLDADNKSVELSILSHNLDDFLTRNYTKSRTVKKFPISDADNNEEKITWPVYGDMETVTIQDTYHGVPYVTEVRKYQIIDTYIIRYFTSAMLACAWIITKNTLSDLPEDPLAYNMSGPKKKYDENNLSNFHGSGTEWMATAVVRTRSLRCTYYYYHP